MTRHEFWRRAAALEQQLFDGRMTFKLYRVAKSKLMWEFAKSNDE